MIKHKYQFKRVLSMILILFFTAVVLINNITELLQSYNFPLSRININIISAIGLFASMVYALVLLDNQTRENIFK
mgnify:FL=1